MTALVRARSAAVLALAVAAVALATLTCGAPDSSGPHAPAAGAAGKGAAGAAPSSAAAKEKAEPAAPGAAAPAGSAAAQAAGLQAWDIVYGVLQHPRCANCHPAGNSPLQGDAMLPHAQNVQRGPDGKGLFGMRCTTCHQTSNLESPHLPPGGPNWHLPSPEMPLVFVGKSKHELCEQLRDPKRNGGKTPEQLYEHMVSEPLVLWGWNPGPGRTPVPVSRENLLQAMRAWVDSGCGCPND